MGSEPGMAWNWCIHLAKYCELHIISEGEFRDKIELILPTLPQGGNMHFYYNPVSEEVRKMCWNQGDWRFYKHYEKWQKKTLEIAKQIISEHKIDILHQLNMIGFREPGYLWKIDNIPFVWGPVDAKEKFPVEYLEGADLKSNLFIRLKNTITIYQLRYSHKVKLAARKASFVVSASTESRNSFKKYFDLDSPLLNETGCYKQKNEQNTKNKQKDTFDLLWVSKLDFRKQLPIAIKTIASLNIENIKLHIVGRGITDKYKELALQLNVSDNCIWHGEVSHHKVQELMQSADLLFFTSVAEGTPHVVLESIANNLPVICFDVCGQGDSVNESIGIKIPLTNPAQSVLDFADVIKNIYNNKSYLSQLSQNCKQRQNELSWDSKAKKMLELYKSALQFDN